MAPHLRVQLLGDVALAIDDTEVDIGGDQPRALLAELALAPGAVRTPGALAEAVWGTDPPANAGRRLQTLVSRMRGALAPHLAGTDPAEVLAGAGRGYALNVDPDAVDAARFERLVEQGEADLAAGDPRKALHHLAEALDAWQGPPFGLIDTPGLQVPADRLVRLRSRASEAQARALIQVGSLDDAAEVAAELVRKEPFRESAVALLMQALYHADRQADALAAYRGLRTRLADELGVDPSLTLQAMERAILVHDPAQLDEIAARAGGTFTQWWQRLPARLRSASATPIVGRSEELRAIVIAGRAVSDGTHRMVLVDGHAGIGKTRLVAEAARTLVTQGFEVLYGRCDEDVRVPYQPVMECLRAFMTTRRPVDPGSLGPNAHELVALVPEIRQIVTTAGDLGDLDPLSARHRLFDAVAAWLATGSRAQPVAVVLDDLHWASPDTILLLRHLVRSEGLGRVLFVAVHRPPDDDSPLARLLGDLRRDQEITRVSLDGLTAPEIGMMAESRGATLSPAAATTVTDATAGNPWFVEQLLHDADEGATLGDGGSLVRLGATTTGIRELVSARAGRLGAEAQRFLRVAAVAGPSFDSRAVADAAELSSDDHGRAEQALIRAGFLELEPEGRRLGFVHALARGALLAPVPDRERRRVHLRLAEGLEQHGAGDDKTLTELAYHFAEAGEDGDPVRAVRYLTTAGTRALSAHAFDEAVRQLTRAVELAAAVEDRSVLADALARLADAQWKAGVETYAETSERAVGVAIEVQDGELLARALLPGWVSILGAQLRDHPEVRAHAETALELLGTDPAQARLAAELRIAHATGSALVTTLSERIALFEVAVEAARDTGDDTLLAYALGSMCISVNHPSTLDARRHAVEELRALRRRIASPRELMTSLQVSFTVALHEGRTHDELAELTAEQTAIGEDARVPVYQGLSSFLRAVVSVLGGELTTAERQLAEGLRLTEYEPIMGRSAAGALTIMLRREQGRIAEVTPMLEQVSEEFGQPPVWMAALSLSYALAGHNDKAREGLDWFATIGVDKLPENAMWAVTLAMLAEAVIDVGGHGLADDLERLLSPWTDQVVFEGGTACFGAIAHHVGRLQGLAGRSREAVASLEQALEIHERMGARPWACRTQLALARELHREGETDRAVTLRQSARAEAEEAAWKGVIEVADRLEQEISEG